MHAAPPFRWLIVGAVCLCTLVALSGCAERSVRVVCPSLVNYSLAEQSVARTELSSASLPELHQFMRDYEGLRDQVRACEKSR